ncbi:MAG: hypothetical protein HGA78_10895 [Nitrospirales bacterium]|nr:hypothetical protein [Nitrospirales bacterium]
MTPTWGGSLSEAASVCLEDQGHANPIILKVNGDYMAQASIERDEVTEQMRRCWNDPEVATEHGAYGLAALLLPHVSGLCVVERSKKGTGFDYWLGSPDDAPLFQGKARLEVSGIRKGTDAVVASRVKQKLKQTNPSDGILPAIIVVVEFGTPQSQVVNKCKR